jgi:hypothetical protein
VPIFPQYLPYHPEREYRSLLRTYLDNFTFGESMRRQPKVTHVAGGHIHRPGRWVVAGECGPIDFRLVGSQFAASQGVVLEL